MKTSPDERVEHIDVPHDSSVEVDVMMENVCEDGPLSEDVFIQRLDEFLKQQEVDVKALGVHVGARVRYLLNALMAGRYKDELPKWDLKERLMNGLEQMQERLNPPELQDYSPETLHAIVERLNTAVALFEQCYLRLGGGKEMEFYHLSSMKSLRCRAEQLQKRAEYLQQQAVAVDY